MLILILVILSIGGFVFASKNGEIIENKSSITMKNNDMANDYFQGKKRKIATKSINIETVKNDDVNKNNFIKTTVVSNAKHKVKKSILKKNISPVNTGNSEEININTNKIQNVDIREKTVNFFGFDKLTIKKSMLAKRDSKSKIIIDTKDIKCYSFKNNSSFSMQLGFEFGIYKPFKKLENTGTSNNELFEIRNKYEMPLEAVRAAAFARIKKKTLPVYLMFGGAYTRITDRLRYNFSYTVQDTVQGIISMTKSENGDTLTIIYGDIIRDKIIEKKVVKHYYFHLIDIPVAIGYEFEFKKFIINAEIGLTYNLNTNTSGFIIDENKNFVSVKNSGLFKSSTNTSYFSAINLIKPVSYNSSMFLNIKGRYIPQNFSNNTNSIRQNYQLTGVNIGSLYYFE